MCFYCPSKGVRSIGRLKPVLSGVIPHYNYTGWGYVYTINPYHLSLLYTLPAILFDYLHIFKDLSVAQLLLVTSYRHGARNIVPGPFNLFMANRYSFPCYLVYILKVAQLLLLSP